MIPRYQTAAMNAIWKAEAYVERWFAIEMAVCRAWAQRGAISTSEWAQISKNARPPTLAALEEKEKTTRHDMTAFVQAMADTVGQPAGRHIHRGLTSSDVLDTALAMAWQQSLKVLQTTLHNLQVKLYEQVLKFQDTACVGRTHGMHAEVTSFGVRLLGFYSELCRNQTRLRQAEQDIAFGKLSGPVGTFSLINSEFEAEVLQNLHLKPEPVATQVVPRDRHAMVMNHLNLLAAACERLALDIRHLQRSEIGEVQEAFFAGQTGSSAMPHKRNPVLSERICGLARLCRGYAQSSMESVALWHERDITHSAVERVVFADMCHVVHFMLLQLIEIISQWQVNPAVMQANVARSGALLLSSRLLSVLLAQGYQRHEAYTWLQDAALAVQQKKYANLIDAVLHRCTHLSQEDIAQITQLGEHGAELALSAQTVAQLLGRLPPPVAPH